MKTVHLLALLLLAGLLLTIFCNYMVLNSINTAKIKGTLPSEASFYLAGSYLGIALFLAGAIGAVLLLIRNMGRR